MVLGDEGSVAVVNESNLEASDLLRVLVLDDLLNTGSVDLVVLRKGGQHPAAWLQLPQLSWREVFHGELLKQQTMIMTKRNNGLIRNLNVSRHVEKDVSLSH